jgi:RimJ/RimL family protein N-acetyltransferase
MTHKSAVTLETERLILRPYTKDDFEIANSWRNNPANSRYLNFEPGNEEQTLNWRNRLIERANAEPRLSYDFAVQLKETGNVIGTCGIYCGSDFDTAGVAWLLHIDHWNKGYGTELCGELLRFGFEDLRLRRITANCAAANHGSYRIMEHNGMRREAAKIKAFWAQVDKEWIDEAEYAILAEEYFKTA